MNYLNICKINSNGKKISANFYFSNTKLVSIRNKRKDTFSISQLRNHSMILRY
jgi:hypothetical protein